MTHTYALLEVSKTTYDEIRGKLEKAGYQHAFMEDGTVDMHGIGIAPEPDALPIPDPGEEAATSFLSALEGLRRLKAQLQRELTSPRHVGWINRIDAFCSGLMQDAGTQTTEPDAEELAEMLIAIYGSEMCRVRSKEVAQGAHPGEDCSRIFKQCIVDAFTRVRAAAAAVDVAPKPSVRLSSSVHLSYHPDECKIHVGQTCDCAFNRRKP